MRPGKLTIAAPSDWRTVREDMCNVWARCVILIPKWWRNLSPETVQLEQRKQQRVQRQIHDIQMGYAHWSELCLICRTNGKSGNSAHPDHPIYTAPTQADRIVAATCAVCAVSGPDKTVFKIWKLNIFRIFEVQIFWKCSASKFYAGSSLELSKIQFAPPTRRNSIAKKARAPLEESGSMLPGKLNNSLKCSKTDTERNIKVIGYSHKRGGWLGGMYAHSWPPRPWEREGKRASGGTTGSALVSEDEDTGNSNPKNGRHW